MNLDLGKACEFIRSELYSTVSVIRDLLRISEDETRQILNELCKYKCIKRRVVPFADTELEIFTITKFGADTLDKPYKPFQRLSVIKMEHTLDMQRIRACVKHVDWQGEHWFYRKGQQRWPITPDARMVTPEKVITAIEVERNRKNPKRYRGIILKHLQNIRCRRYEYVVYFCPVDEAVETLSNIFYGQCENLDIKYRDYFGFYKYPF